METIQTVQSPQPISIEALYSQAARMLVNDKRTSEDVIDALVSQGVPYDSANTMVSNLEDEIRKAKKSRAQKDMLYGGLWCVGGIVLTAASIGFIFWGAIVFGGIQFFKGLFNSFEN